jgi:hypothetical protein
MLLKCCNCGKENLDVNYCNFDCIIETAKKAGGKVITPNNLPIGCVTCDYTMLECEHGDHPSYKFPVVVKYIGKREPDAHEFDYADETHALIFFDDTIALTLHECCYYVFSLKTGILYLSEYDFEINNYQLTEESLQKIKEDYENK